MSSSTPNPARVVLEKDVSYSQSLLWRRMREAYVQRGLQAWTEDRIPNFITNNPFLAEVYARLVAAFLADCGPLGLTEPLQIFEVGAGTGKFAFLFLRLLTALLRQRNVAAENFLSTSIRYTMADCSGALLQTWRSDARLQEFVQQGILQFALCDDELPAGWLQHSGPRVLIANYVFDSLPHDAYQVARGELSEFLLTSSAQSAGTALKALDLSFRAVPVASPRYKDERWEHILQQYRHAPDATVLFPAGALRLLAPLLQDRMPLLVLAADKGIAHPEALSLLQGPPAPEFHSSDFFSVLPNFDAIARFFQSHGGEALLPERHFFSLNICGFLHGREPGGFPATAREHREGQAFGTEDLFTLLAWLHPHMDEMTPPQVLALLRLTRFDPMAFLRLFPVLARRLRNVAAERTDLREAVLRVWTNHFPSDAAEHELPFDCGAILLGLGFHADAVPMFEASLQVFGPSAATSYNLALCCQALQRLPQAMAHAREAVRLDPKFQPAADLLQQLSSSSLAQ